MPKMKFPTQAKRLKEIRLARGVTLYQAAQMTGIQITRLSRLECGMIELKLSEWIQIQREFGEIVFPNALEHLDEAKKYWRTQTQARRMMAGNKGE